MPLMSLFEHRTAFLAILLFGCTGTSETTTIRDAGPVRDAGMLPCGGCPDGQVCEGGQCLPPLANKCVRGIQWIDPAPAFSEATEAWGLADIGALGTRLATADVNGDGWADLLIRRGGNASDDFGPEGARRTWLLINDGNGRFVDTTVASGLRQTRSDQGTLGRPGEVVAFADVDNDGDLDLYTGMWTGVDNALAGETSELMFNDGEGNFSFGPVDSPIRRVGLADSVAGATFVDFDRDGMVDLWVGHDAYTPAGRTNVVFANDVLFKNIGAGYMADVTADSGLVTADWVDLPDINQGLAHSRAWSTAACDLDGDGNPELLASSYGRAPNHLWHAARDETGAVTFSNESVASGYAYDENFTWQDNEFAKCYCQADPLAAGCDEVEAPRISCQQMNWRHQSDREAFRLGGNSGTTVCADVNNDGRMDLLTTEITHWWAGTGSDRSELLINDGDMTFTRPGLRATGLERGNSGTWDNGDITAAVFDFDNDAYADIYIGATDYPGNRGLLFHQREPMQFRAVPVSLGIEHNRSHGLAVADFDRDGDLDMVIGHSRARCSDGPAPCYDTQQVRMFENVIGHRGNWVQISLEGAGGTNRAAIGARVEVRGADILQVKEVGGGHGHYGIQHDLVLHFGLGPACEAEVTVRWPDAFLTTETFTVQTGYRYVKKQGEPALPIRE